MLVEATNRKCVWATPYSELVDVMSLKLEIRSWVSNAINTQMISRQRGDKIVIV